MVLENQRTSSGGGQVGGVLRTKHGPAGCSRRLAGSVWREVEGTLRLIQRDWSAQFGSQGKDEARSGVPSSRQKRGSVC